MKNPFSWIILILPIVSTYDDNASNSFEEEPPPIFIQGPTNLDQLLHVYGIANLKKLSSCRSQYANCPLVKQGFLTLVENVCNHYTHHNTLKKSISVRPTTEPASSDLEKIKAKFDNEVTAESTIYLALWAYGSLLGSEQIQRFTECYTNANQTLIDYFKTINHTLDNSARKRLSGVFMEKIDLDGYFKRISQEIALNLTKQEQQLKAVLTEIHEDNYLIAMTKFCGIENDELIATIIHRLIRDKAAIEKLLEFIKILPSWHVKLIGYQLMLKHQLGFSLFTLEYDFHQSMRPSISNWRELKTIANNEELLFNMVQKELQLQVDEGIKLLLLVLYTRELKIHNDMIEYASNKPKPFNAHLEELVEKMFAGKNVKDEPEEAEDIFIFADNLTHITQSARVYVKLVDLLIINHVKNLKVHMKISANVRQLTLMENYINTPQELKDEVEILKEKILPIVRRIFWGKVCIKNLHFEGYLHVKKSSDRSWRRVTITKDVADRWEFINRDGGSLFQIRNVDTKEYLYRVDGFVLAGHGENYSSDSWTLLPVSETTFLIKENAGGQIITCTGEAMKFLLMDNSTESPELNAINHWYFIDSENC